MCALGNNIALETVSLSVKSVHFNYYVWFEYCSSTYNNTYNLVVVVQIIIHKMISFSFIVCLIIMLAVCAAAVVDRFPSDHRTS